MTTPNPKVAAWAESMGYTLDALGSWRKLHKSCGHYEYMSQDQATFMYRQYAQAIVDEARFWTKLVNQRTNRDISFEYYVEQWRERVVSAKKLEAELQELEKENSMPKLCLLCGVGGGIVEPSGYHAVCEHLKDGETVDSFYESHESVNDYFLREDRKGPTNEN